MVIALDGRADRVRCGPGRDRLVGDRRERARGCERRVVGTHVRLVGSGRLLLYGRSPRDLGVELDCPVYALGECRGRLEARTGGVLVARGRYRGGNQILPDMRLTAAGRRLLRPGGRVTVSARGGDASGAIRVVTRQFRLGRG